jgi:NAD(P)-dependent dehydrogenase (short-subunit alcohol dehydrogenase family)
MSERVCERAMSGPAEPGLDLAGQVAVITGGSRGIGRGIATGFLAAGAEVIVCGRQVPAELPAAGARSARFVAADVRDVDQLDRIIGAAVDGFGRLDILVNNAGGSPAADAATASPRFSAAIIQLNLIAPLWLAQRANAVMQEQPEGGVIVNIASVSGTRPSPGTAAYGAAKAGLVNLTQSLAVEWAPRVRVNAVVAGPIETEQAHLHYGDAAGITAVAATIPLGRLGRPEDVADACLFLASSRARWVSGAALVVHGGGERPAFLAAARPAGGTP